MSETEKVPAGPPPNWGMPTSDPLGVPLVTTGGAVELPARPGPGAPQTQPPSQSAAPGGPVEPERLADAAPLTYQGEAGPIEIIPPWPRPEPPPPSGDSE